MFMCLYVFFFYRLINTAGLLLTAHAFGSLRQSAHESARVRSARYLRRPGLRCGACGACSRCAITIADSTSCDDIPSSLGLDDNHTAHHQQHYHHIIGRHPFHILITYAHERCTRFRSVRGSLGRSIRCCCSVRPTHVRTCA